MGQQDQAMLGTESGLAVPDGEGGVDLHISTQWMHVDHRQIVACLGLRPEQVRLHLAGIGGAFGAREDLTPADPPLPAGPAHRAPGEDGLRPGRVLRRPRPPPPRPPLVPPRGRPAGQPGAGRGPPGPRRRRLRGDQRRGGRQRRLLRRRPLPLPLGAGSTPWPPAPTTRPPGRCGASGPTRSASPTRRRWIAWPPPWASTPSTCACATPWATATACPPPTRRSPGACPPPR